MWNTFFLETMKIRELEAVYFRRQFIRWRLFVHFGNLSLFIYFFFHKIMLTQKCGILSWQELIRNDEI